MIRLIAPLLAALFLAQTAFAASVARVELNALQSAGDKCRAVFVTENKSGSAITVLKLDLAFFNPKGVVFERFIGDLAPILAAKTMITNFDVNAPCDQIGSVLVNTVTACAPASAAECLQGLELSSRVDKVRFYQ
jgi:hypothetical protein